jgi:hypothetical protein
MSAVVFNPNDVFIKALIKASVNALAPAIKKALDTKKVNSFDEKLQRSYFLVGKKK